MSLVSGTIYSDMDDVVLEGIDFEALSIEQNMGDIEMMDVNCETTMTLSQQMGDVSYQGKHPGNIEVDSSMGDIDLEISGQEEDYRYDLDTSMGGIQWNHQSEDDGFSNAMAGGDRKANYLIKAKSRMGDIKVVFR